MARELISAFIEGRLSLKQLPQQRQAQDELYDD